MTLRGLLQAAAALTIVFSVGSLLPVDHFAVQLFTHFRLQYLGGGLVLLLGFVVLHEPRYAAAMLLLTAINAYSILPWYFDERPGGAGSEVKLLVANVLASNDDHDKLLALIDAEQPDLLFLMEISPGWEESLRRLHADYPQRIVEPRIGNFGIAMFSKIPVISSALVDSPPLRFPTIVATLEAGGRPVHVVGTHPMVPLGGDNYDARNAQLDGIARLLQQMRGSKMLVGDLNTTMWDANYGALENRTWLRNVRQGFGVLPTWPVFMPPAMIPIDHVLVSDDIGVSDVRTGARIGSDHLPLVVTITL